MDLENFNKWPHFEAEDLEAVSEVLKSGKINRWTGDKNILFEDALGRASAAKYAIAVSNGTSALELALVGLGMRPGDEVITTCRTFMASASCVAVRGGIPIVADVDADSQNITAETIEPLITPKTKGIIVVHLMGWPCDMDPIMDLAKRRGLWVVEDCAQAHGAVYKGRPVGSIGDVGAWSFCQDKIITTGGEGGAVTTNNRDVYLKMWSYKDHGRDYDLVFNKKHPEGFRWYLESFGTNMRMTEMQAVLGIRGFKNLPKWHARRTANAKILSEAISKIPCARVPVRPGSIEHANYKFFFFTRPEALKSGWSAARVISEICARKIPAFSGTCWNISQENCFKKAGLSKSESELPVAALLRDTSVMTLIHPTLGDSEMEFAAEQICGVLKAACR